MKQKPNIPLAMVASAALLLLVALALCSRGCRQPQPTTPTTDTVFIERVDTVRVIVPHTDTVTVTEWKPYYIKVTDTVTVTDSVLLWLPYEHHHYSVPDTLDVWYSGFDPKIDSAVIYAHHITEIVNNNHFIEVNKMPRLTLGIGAAAAWYDGQVWPAAVVDLRYNAQHVTWGAFGAVDPQLRWCAGLSLTYRLNIIQ